MEKGDPCPFGVCKEGEGRNSMIESLANDVKALNKSLSLLAGRVRVLQFIVVAGVIIDFLVNSRAGQAAVAFVGR